MTTFYRERKYRARCNGVWKIFLCRMLLSSAVLSVVVLPATPAFAAERSDGRKSKKKSQRGEKPKQRESKKNRSNKKAKKENTKAGKVASAKKDARRHTAVAADQRQEFATIAPAKERAARSETSRAHAPSRKEPAQTQPATEKSASASQRAARAIEHNSGSLPPPTSSAPPDVRRKQGKSSAPWKIWLGVGLLLAGIGATALWFLRRYKKACIHFGADQLKKNLPFYVGGPVIFTLLYAALVVFHRPPAILVFFLPSPIDQFVWVCADVIAALFPLPLLLGYCKGIHDAFDGGSVELGALFAGYKQLGPVLLNLGLPCTPLFVAYVVLELLTDVPSSILNGTPFQSEFSVFILLVMGVLFLSLSPLGTLTMGYMTLGITAGLEPLASAITLLMRNPSFGLWHLALAVFASVGLLLFGAGVLATIPVALCAGYMIFREVESVPPKA